MAEHRNQPCCYFCRKDLRNIESNATNLKCEDCIQKMEAVPSGLPFKLVNENKGYECAIFLFALDQESNRTAMLPFDVPRLSSAL